jgi:hypothetical protein
MRAGCCQGLAPRAKVIMCAAPPARPQDYAAAAAGGSAEDAASPAARLPFKQRKTGDDVSRKADHWKESLVGAERDRVYKKLLDVVHKQGESWRRTAPPGGHGQAGQCPTGGPR